MPVRRVHIGVSGEYVGATYRRAVCKIRGTCASMRAQTAHRVLVAIAGASLAAFSATVDAVFPALLSLGGGATAL